MTADENGAVGRPSVDGPANASVAANAQTPRAAASREPRRSRLGEQVLQAVQTRQGRFIASLCGVSIKERESKWRTWSHALRHFSKPILATFGCKG